MAKKEKKEKKQKKGKEKPEKKRRKGEEEDENPNIPYPGSDKTKVRQARLLILLSAVCLGLIIYTIHYIRYVNVKKQEVATAQAAAEAAAASPLGESWYLRPDGTFISLDGPSASQPAIPGAVTPAPAQGGEEPNPEESPEGETQQPAEGEEGEAQQSAEGNPEGSAQEPTEGETESETQEPPAEGENQ